MTCLKSEQRPRAPSGASRGSSRRAAARPKDQLFIPGPIHSGVVMRRHEQLSSAASRLLDFTRSRCDSQVRK
jgi:hypothetical protein